MARDLRRRLPLPTQLRVAHGRKGHVEPLIGKGARGQRRPEKSIRVEERRREALAVGVPLVDQVFHHTPGHGMQDVNRSDMGLILRGMARAMTVRRALLNGAHGVGVDWCLVCHAYCECNIFTLTVKDKACQSIWRVQSFTVHVKRLFSRYTRG